MINRLKLIAVVAAALVSIPGAASAASLLGDSITVSVFTSGGTFSDNVVVVDPAVELTKGDASNIDTGFWSSPGIGGDLFDSGSIDIVASANRIDILFNVQDAIGPLGPFTVGGVIFQFDGLDFSPNLKIGSVTLTVLDSTFDANNCVTLNNPSSPCIAFDPNLGRIRTEVWSDSINTVSYSIEINNVPEPGTFVLMGLGLLGLAAIRRRKA